MSDDTIKAFGQVLQQTRKQLGMSQAGLALASGLDRAFISKLELGKKQPSLLTVFQLATALGLAPSGLLRRVERFMKLAKASKQPAACPM